MEVTIPQKLINKMVRDYKETRSVHAAAKRCGLGATTVHRYLKQMGIECDGLAIHRKRIRKLPEGDVLLAEYENGRSLGELATRYDCTVSTVQEALKKLGATMRPRGNKARRITESEAMDIKAQYEELGSQQAVAALRGISQIRVSRALRSLGVTCGRMSGEKHPSWKGGRGPAPGGYVSVLLPVGDSMRVMADKSGRVMEHRLVMALALGRPLLAHETVHHIDGDKTNNQLSNLQLRAGRHGKGVALKCRCCGSTDVITSEL